MDIYVIAKMTFVFIVITLPVIWLMWLLFEQHKINKNDWEIWENFKVEVNSLKNPSISEVRNLYNKIKDYYTENPSYNQFINKEISSEMNYLNGLYKGIKISKLF